MDSGQDIQSIFKLIGHQEVEYVVQGCELADFMISEDDVDELQSFLRVPEHPKSINEIHKALRLNHQIRHDKYIALWYWGFMAEFDPFIRQSRSLNLSGKNGIGYAQRKNLLLLPSSLGNLHHVQHLDLSFQGLLEMPEFFYAYSELEELILNDNGFQQMPALENFPKLKVLNMGQNHLRFLNSDFCTLLELQQCNLQNNRIEFFPPEMAELTKIKQLNMRNNLLRELPDWFVNLQDLEHLVLHANNIRSDIDFFATFPKLSYLSYNNQKISKISKNG